MMKGMVAFGLLSAACVFAWIQSNSGYPVLASDKKMVGFLDIGGSMVVGIYGDGSVRMTPRPK